MDANEFVGFTLPVVNEGPWSNFSAEKTTPTPTPPDSAVVGTAIVGTAKAA